jgi:eukaryotic-like serine/threonine-protein kinase
VVFSYGWRQFDLTYASVDSRLPLQFGSYRAIRSLAQGGMGEVFLAEQTGPGGFSRLAVVKRILPDREFDKNTRQLFLDEARVAAHLTHPNLVQVFEFGEAEQSYFMAMEYIRGLTVAALTRALKRRAELVSPEIAVHIAVSALRGLHYAHTATDDQGHSLNIVHRDISPDNIMVSTAGLVKVLDFGIAKAVGQTPRTSEGTVRGKMAYLSPEQLFELKVDRRCDVRAVGVVLFEMLTGERFVASTIDVGQFAQFVVADPPPVHIRAPQVPLALAALIDKSVRRLPEARFDTAEAFAEALESWAAQQPSHKAQPALAALVEQLFVPILHTGDSEQPLASPVPSRLTMSLPVSVSASTEVRPAKKLPRSVMLVGAACLTLSSLPAVWFYLSKNNTDAVESRPKPAQAPLADGPIEPPVTPTPAKVIDVPPSVPAVAVSPTAVDGGRAMPLAPARREGRLDIRVSPWAHVFVDGKSVGQTPMEPLTLTVGTHRVRLFNPELQLERETTVKVLAGQRAEIRINLLE